MSTLDHDDVSWRQWCAVLAMSLGAFTAILDIQIINASLREIQGSMSIDFAEGGWIATVYLIAEIVVIPMTAFLSDAIGPRRFAILNTVVFSFSSAACGCSWNLGSLLFFRALQGLSGGSLIPMAFQTILTTLPQSRRNLGLTIFGLVATLAPTLGPALGGILTDACGWRSIFFLNLFPGALIICLLYLGMPASPFRPDRFKNLDGIGALMLAIGLGCVTYMLERGAEMGWFEDNHIRWSLLISILAFTFFFVSHLSRQHPLLKLRLLLNWNFGLAAFITVVTSLATYGGVYATALYLGQVQSYSARDIGAVMMWLGIPQFLIVPFIPFLMKRFDLRLLAICGFALFVYSSYLNTHLDQDYGGQQFRWSMIIRAIGQPLIIIPLSSLAMSMVDATDAGDASAIYNMLRNLGGSLGIAMVSTFVTSRATQHVSNQLNSMSPDNVMTTSDLTGLQTVFLQNGYSLQDAQALTARQVLKATYTNGLIESFGDVFYVLTLGLLLCAAFVFALKKNSARLFHAGH